MTQLLTHRERVPPDQQLTEPIRVVIVDDSSFIRRAIRRLLASEPNLVVVGEAQNGVQALDLVASQKPDVVTLDLNMPVMDGIRTIKHLMIRSPVPVLMLSTLTSEGAKVTFDALRYGATDFMRKPSRLGATDAGEEQKEIVQRIKNAASVRMDAIRYVRLHERKKRPQRAGRRHCECVVGIGAAEGGCRPLLQLIPALNPDRPVAYIVVFYARESVVNALERYLADYSAVRVVRAKNNMPLRSATCYLLDGDKYATLHRQGDGVSFRLQPNPFPGRRGSVNMMLFSLAETFQKNAAGVVLSGAGEDGAEGLREIRRHGGHAFVQRPETCLYKEMPLMAAAHCEKKKIVCDRELSDGLDSAFYPLCATQEVKS